MTPNKTPASTATAGPGDVGVVVDDGVYTVNEYMGLNEDLTPDVWMFLQPRHSCGWKGEKWESHYRANDQYEMHVEGCAAPPTYGNSGTDEGRA